MPVNQKFSILEPLAKELGYKDAKEMKAFVGKEKKKKEKDIENLGGGGFFGGKEVGSGFKKGILKRLEKGESLSGSFKGGFSDFAKTFSKENIKRRTLEKAFGGSGFISSFARGKIKPKYKESLSKSGGFSKEKIATTGGDASATLSILAKNSLLFQGMARDVNVMRQNLQKIVKLFGAKPATSKEKKDPFKLGRDLSEGKEKERYENLRSDSETERAEDISFFKEQDKIESEQEASRQKGTSETKTSPTQEKTPTGKGFSLDGIIDFFSKNFIAGLKQIFNPRTILKFLGKAGLVGIIVGAVYGVFKGFKKLFDGGSFKDAFIAAWGGFLNVLTFGFFGEDEIRNLWTAVSDFMKPVTDTISSIFTGVKDFFKRLFGMGGEEDKSEKEIKKEPAKMPDPKEFIKDSVKSSGGSDEKAADISGLFDTAKKGDAKGLFAQVQELAKKYPSEEKPASETSPTQTTKEEIPAEQAQRNYELNKQLTSDVSKTFGVNLPTPEPPKPPPPSVAPTAVAPTPSPKASNEDKIKQYEEHIESNKKRFARREEGAKRHIESFKKRYGNDPERVKELEDEYAATLKKEKAEIEEANKGFQNEIDILKKSNSPSISSNSESTPQTPATAPTESQGASDTSGSISSSTSTPMLDVTPSSVSGSEMSKESSSISEGQRMESSAEQGSVINAPVTNKTTGVTGKQPKIQTASVFNEDLTNILGFAGV